ncbi:serine/threonine-protein kinase [Actinomadura flavalba]|uniref:serine/threonine-protein kinase n=1 Tax=Actinomadura flavalba TaxID=1120938 RepID=UPI00039C07A4|nr:serine/threonine-protein kinase [Actinomadura flavalba]
MAQDRFLGGRYRLDAVVGRGGMGTVWRAHDRMLDREVAVKEIVLPPGLTHAERDVLYERTFREARASARLNHPGVVTVHDVVEESDRPWIVMELVRASSLQDHLEQGALPHRRVAEIGLQMLAALRAAHEKGILHRDVKPSNVLITASGRVVLTDFGIAQMEGDATLTQTGLVMGSPAYIPPERARGERAVPASDLWALGATMYAALEGRSPYERSDAMSSLQAALLEPVPPARNAGPLADVLDGLLAREPRFRMTGAQAEPLLSRVASMPDAPATFVDGTIVDEPSARFGVPERAADTVLDSAELEPRTRRDRSRSTWTAEHGRPPVPAEPEARTLLEPGRWEPRPQGFDPPGTPPGGWTAQDSGTAPSGPVFPPQTPPGGQHYPSWQEQRPARGGADRERRKTMIIVTIAVVLAVAAVLAGAFIIRQRLAETSALPAPVPPAVAVVPAAP